MTRPAYTASDRLQCYWMLRQFRHRAETELWRTPLRAVERRAGLIATLTKLDGFITDSHEVLRPFQGEERIHAMR